MRKRSLMLEKLLCVLLSVAMVLQGVPAVPAYADEVAGGASVLQGDVAPDVLDEVQDGAEAQEEDALAKQERLDVETTTSAEPSDGGTQLVVAKSRTLKTSFTTVDGVRYAVEATFADNAGVPADATLRVQELRAELTSEELEDPANSDRPQEGERFVTAEELALHQKLLRAAIGVNADEAAQGSALLDVSIESGGVTIDVSAPIHLVIATDAIGPDKASTVQVALLGSEGLKRVQELDEPDLEAERLAKQLEEGHDYWVLKATGAPSKTSEQVDITFETEQLGELGLVWECDVADIPAEEEATLEESTALESSTELIEAVKTEAAATEQAQAATLSKTFTLKGQRGSASRSSLVTFVDQFSTPINSVISGTVILNYADGTTDYPDTLDMYDYADKLDPDIADQYVFSRVYIKLGNDPLGYDQKEFRYFRVSTDYDIHGKGGTATRLYTYLDDIKVDTATTGVYYGTWYTFPNGGNRAADNVYIEFDRVAEVSFKAVDEKGEPVEGAEFTLYSDANCYREYEYQGRVVTATSDSSGLVSFGKLPYNDNENTYYMKETGVPEGYKDAGTVYEVKAEDGADNPDIMHYEDDGSVILSNIKLMNIEVTWADGDAGHEDDVVTVEAYSQGVRAGSVELAYSATESEKWKGTIAGLEHTKPYVVTEKSITRNGEDITSKWIPKITYEAHDPEVGYYQAEDFQKGKEYVLVSSEGKALATSGSALTVEPATVKDSMLTSTVDSSMLWRVESMSNDGVITLYNASTNRYLNYFSSGWSVGTASPKFVRQYNSDGDAILYYRENKNASKATYLVVGDAVSSTTDYTKATSFELFQRIEVHAVTVMVRNHSTEYPIRIKNMQYYTDEPLPGGSYMLYTDSEFEGHCDADGRPVLEDMEPVYDEVHVADESGYLQADGGRDFQLWADTYYLVQKSTSDGYLPNAPAWLKFTVTRTGAVRVERTKEQFPDYTYVSSDEEDGTTYPLLRVPNQGLATVTLQKNLVDDSLDDAATQALSFAFDAQLQDALGHPVTDWDFAENTTTNEEGEATLALAAGGQMALQVPVGDTLTLTETSQGYAVKVAQDEGEQTRVQSLSYVVPGDGAVTFTNIKPICKIEDDGVEQPFESLNAAVDYAREHMAGKQATIEMLVDYEQPLLDVVTFEEGDNIVLTTAGKQDASSTKIYHYSGTGDVATITRAHDGGSMLGGSGLLRLTNITLEGNSDTYSQLGLNGGILSWSAGSLTLGDGVALRSSAVVASGSGQGHGGAVYLSGTATLDVAGATITGCSAVRGGGIYSASTGTVRMTSGEASSCSASDAGGAFWLGVGSSLSLGETVALTNNVALGSGGALYAQGASVSLAGTVSHNRASEGGGIYCGGTTVQMLEGAKIEANNALTSGGGVYVAEQATLTMGAGMTVTGNEAGNGGGIFVAAGGIVELSSEDAATAASVTDNSADVKGAGIFLASEGKLKLSGLVTIDLNEGTGNLYLAADATGAEIEVTGNLSEGSRILVWAEDASRDGRQITVDEPFGITTDASAATVAGLESFVSQRAADEEDMQITAIAGVGSAVVWGIRSTVEVRLEAAGTYADQTKKFDFELTLPEGELEVQATVAGKEVTFTSSNNSFQLAHGEVLVLKDIQAYEPHVITQTSANVVSGAQATGLQYTTTVQVDEAPEGSSSTITLLPSSDTRIATFTAAVGTAEDPARLVITNTLADDAVAQTGLDDNALVWLGIVGGALLGIALLLVLRRRRQA